MTLEYRNNLSNVWSRISEVNAVRGEGIYLYDEEGTRYIDFTSGIGVTSTGHCHPRVVEAVQKQAERLIFGQMNTVINSACFGLIKELLSVVPENLDTFFFSNSGAEAVESAVKLAKQVTNRQNVVVFQGSFHGRSHLTMAMTTSKTVYRGFYQPLVPGVFTAPFPSSYYYGWDDETTMGFVMKELDRLFKSQTSPEETACVVVEPVLGEGGYVVPPKGFLSALRKFCTDHDVLLIADEIQSGFGRTGRYFAVQHEAVEPDILVMAKGMASGMPISCIAYPREMEKVWKRGSHGGTYGGGSAVAHAAAAETVRIIKDEELDRNARERGEQLQKALTELSKDFDSMGDVRGLGLMTAVEFSRGREPDPDTAKTVIREAVGEKLLLLPCGTYGNVVRWIPPLIVTEAQIDEGVEIFTKVLNKASK
jgi:4-aminobutyrate aminotransferase